MHGLSVTLSELIALERASTREQYRSPASALRQGQHISRLRGRGMDFAEARNYQAGDEIRHMEWRVTARTGRPHVKVYQEERERPVVILTDFSPSMYFGTRIALKSVVAARLAAILAWTAAKQGDRVGGFLCQDVNHREFIPRARREGVLPLLAALSQYTENNNQSSPNNMNAPCLAHALKRIRRVTKPGSTIILISDFYHLERDAQIQLSRLCNHNDILAYHVCDPLELAPPIPGRYAITDGEQDTMLDTSLDTVRFGYQFYCEQRLNALQSQFRQLRIPYIQVTASTNLTQLIRQTFPKRG